MTFDIIGSSAGVLLALAIGATVHARRRRSPSIVAAAPVVLSNIRLLRDEDEIGESARRAYERERMIVLAAERRAEHFDKLSHRLEP